MAASRNLPRSSIACESCRRRKSKCSGEHPCQACTKNNWDCVFGNTGRRRYAEAQVKKLLDKVSKYEKQLASQDDIHNTQSPNNDCAEGSGAEGSGVEGSGAEGSGAEGSGAPLQSPAKTSDFIPSPSIQQESVTLSAATATGSYENNENLPEELPCGESADFNGMIPAIVLKSGPAFESQVRSLLHSRFRASVPSNSGMNSNTRGSGGCAQQWTSVQGLVDNADDTSIPSLEESKHLLHQFIYYLGISQHFFDSRAFSDSMMLLFQNAESHQQQIKTLWYAEYLLVMAMAKLMNFEQPKSQPPGSGLFVDALKRLPPLHKLGEGGVIGVEILTLIATYLQWCDRRHDAYLHIGLAIRLAIALGCNLPENEQDCLPSQSAHRVRLWWTVYMLDRRISSGLGLAAGADERQLRAEFPRHAVGFQSPGAIIINVRIARITDEIMSSLYGNTAITQLELVKNIQLILQELYNIGRSFPQSLVLDFNRPLERVTRTGSSLYLMLFQAIILCTRPILLRRVSLQVQRQPEYSPTEPDPEILTRLCDTCHEASMRSLAILYSLKKQQTIPRYGSFDLDATFSAAFVLVMAGVADGSQGEPSPALDQAFQILKFLSHSGNPAAEHRLQDILRSCSHVWPNYVFNGALSGVDVSQAQSTIPGCESRKGPPSDGFSAPPKSMALMQDSGQFHMYENRLLESSSHSTSDTILGVEGGWGVDLMDEAEVIYSSFYNSTLLLTGIDYTDWLEIEKVFSTPEGI